MQPLILFWVLGESSNLGFQIKPLMDSFIFNGEMEE